MDAFKANRDFEVAAMPAVKRALQECADVVWGRAGEKTAVTSLLDATPQQDMQEATDLKLGRISRGTDKVDIAVRVRGHKYWRNTTYREQFTIRRQTAHGARTEIHKVMEGFGTFMFYGFESAGGTDRLIQFTVIDLDVFRGCVKQWPNPAVRWEDVPNWDYTRGAAFSFSSFPKNLVVCGSRDGGRSLYVPRFIPVVENIMQTADQGVLF
jgi:hypothetical protein